MPKPTCEENPTARRLPLDQDLIRRGLAADIDEARNRIERGEVLVGGAFSSNPSRQVDPGDAVVLAPARPPFVSRAGHKLDAALDRFGIDVTGRVAVDVGSSTGGFTDCLVQRGAARVLAVDVGTHQLHERLRANDRVIVFEQTDIRSLPLEALVQLGTKASLAVVDVSFVSLRAVLPAVFGIMSGGRNQAAAERNRGADVVALIKPQFEATKTEADRGQGIITDITIWSRVIADVETAASALGGVMMDLMVSPITGQHGNVEFVAHLVLHAVDSEHGHDVPAVTPLIESAIDAVITASPAGE